MYTDRSQIDVRGQFKVPTHNVQTRRIIIINVDITGNIPAPMRRVPVTADHDAYMVFSRVALRYFPIRITRIRTMLSVRESVIGTKLVYADVCLRGHLPTVKMSLYCTQCYNNEHFENQKNKPVGGCTLLYSLAVT